jgi:thiol-disulfide isomerase/thioredoxin
MKRIILLAIFYCVGILGQKLLAQGYQINLQCNYKAGLAYLTYYQGKNLALQDSALVGKTGAAVFKGKQNLPAGIYSVVFPGKRLTTDFLIEKEQKISIVADTNNLENVKVTGSSANILFKEYQTYVASKGKFINEAKRNYEQAKTKADSSKYENAYKKLSEELNTYRMGIIKNKPTSMMAALLLALKESPYPTKTPITRQDSIDNYYFYKSNYWTGISFLDDRIVRTPFFLPKLENYYRNVMPQAADSLIKDIDYRLILARSAPEMFKFLLNWFTDEYISPKYMGQDAVFVHLYQKYHSQGLSKWLPKSTDSIITRRAFMLMGNLIGEPAANLQMLDTNEKPTSLYDVKGKYTLLLFWDPNCGHCKETIPRIDSIYRAAWQKKDLKIYAMLSEKEKLKPEWKKFISEKNIGDWVHVYQSDAMAEADEKAGKASYKQLFDILSTPTILLLDKDKRIVAKKLTIDQINDFINSQEKK